MRFTETINPDNRFQFCNQDKTDEIIIGADVTHIFELPFIYSLVADSAEVIYKQGLTHIWVFSIDDRMIVEDNLKGISFINLHLSPTITSEFKTTLLNTNCQVKVQLKSGEIIYDIPHKIIVRKPLEN